MLKNYVAVCWTTDKNDLTSACSLKPSLLVSKTIGFCMMCLLVASLICSFPGKPNAILILVQ